jgi:hypothetical protein
MMEPSEKSKASGLEHLLTMYPNHVPTIVHGKCLTKDGVKLIVSKGTVVASFLSLLRKKGMLNSSSASRGCFVIVDALLPTNSKTFGELFEEAGRGVLQVNVCEESTFGADHSACSFQKFLVCKYHEQ